MACLALAFVIGSALPASAQYKSRPIGQVQQDTKFNKFTDWMATLGKPQQEKYRIKAERRAARKVDRAKKRIEAQKKAFAKKGNNYKN